MQRANAVDSPRHRAELPPAWSVTFGITADYQCNDASCKCESPAYKNNVPSAGTFFSGISLMAAIAQAAGAQHANLSAKNTSIVGASAAFLPNGHPVRAYSD